MRCFSTKHSFCQWPKTGTSKPNTGMGFVWSLFLYNKAFAYSLCCLSQYTRRLCPGSNQQPSTTSERGVSSSTCELFHQQDSRLCSRIQRRQTWTVDKIAASPSSSTLPRMKKKLWKSFQRNKRAAPLPTGPSREKKLAWPNILEGECLKKKIHGSQSVCFLIHFFSKMNIQLPGIMHSMLLCINNPYTSLLKASHRQMQADCLMQD